MVQRTCTVAGCSLERGDSRLYCPMHYARVRRNGDPGEAESRKHRTSATDAERLARIGWTVVVRVPDLGPCWEWNGTRYANGYGRITVADRHTNVAHRIALEDAIGLLEPGLEACHRCDNPPCVNPAHLFAGTSAENSADMIRKERDLRGARSPYAKLTPQEAQAIRDEYAAGGVTQTVIAERYGVGQAAVSRIIRKVSY